MCSDGVRRPRWAHASPVLWRYHDEEWNRLPSTESGLFEVQSLLVFAVGLSFGVVLRRRDALRELFEGFDVDAVASFDAARVEAVARDPRGIRNPDKVRAVVANAETTARLREQGGLAGMLGSSAVAPFEADGPEAFVWARDLATRLRAAGYRYVGAGSTFAFLQAIGMLSPTAHPGGVADGTRTSDAPTPAETASGP